MVQKIRLLPNWRCEIKVARPTLQIVSLNRVTSDSSVVLTETTLTTSDSIETGSPIETEIVREVTLVQRK